MNSTHYDVIIYTGDTQRAVRKIEELMKKNYESIFKVIPNEKYITDTRTYKIVSNYKGTRGNRYYEAYIDANIPESDVIENIYPYCLPHTEDWKKRIHKF